MPDMDWALPMVVAGIFVLFGLAGILWGKREQARYDEWVASHRDLRELMDRWPPHPEPGALRLGGWIAVIIGLVTLLLGVIFLLWG